MNDYGIPPPDHSSYIVAAFVIGCIFISGYNLWLHFQRRRTLAMTAALEK